MGELFVWWLVIEGLGFLAFPLTFRLLSARADHGYLFAKIVALLCIGYASWLLGHFGVPFGASVAASAAGLVGLNLALAWFGRAEIAAWLRGPGLRTVLLHDAFWTVGFLFFAWQRSLAPEIFGAEKYMDFAFFNTLTRSDVMPPQDMWMSGKPFNYYYFGYLVWANLARMTPIPNHIAYNFCVVTVGGLAFGQFAALGLMLTRRLPFAWLTGVVGMVIGNLDGFLQLVEKGGFTRFDYWRSSRVVAKGDTINEFPYFTTIHGDLHPHFIVLPVTLLLLALLLDPDGIAARVRRAADGAAATFRDLWPYLPVTFLVATMVVISTWELPVAAMITFLLVGRDLPIVSRPRLRLVAVMVAILAASYFLYLPFYLHFKAPGGGGVGFKFASTSLVEFLVVFGALLLPPALLLARETGGRLSITPEKRQLAAALVAFGSALAYMKGNAVFPLLVLLGAVTLACVLATDESERRAPLLLVLGATVALLACELVYVKDPYGEKLYRMNTVFKLYFQAWILLTVALPWCWQQLLDTGKGTAGMRRFALVGVAALLLASCAYPVGITATRLTGRVVPPTLDGTEYLSREHPDDFAAIRWLRENVHGLPVILEATGNPYSYYARFSSNTGLPTLMGWGNHEGLWRSNEPEVGRRAQDVNRIYTAPTLEEITPLLDQYGIRYIAVGELERKDHAGPGLGKFASLKVAFSRGGTTIYER